MLKVYNTLTKRKEEFVPLHPPFVGMYVCGPTVYDDPHLGHAKSYVSFDVIIRFLRASCYKVRYVQNITDVGHLLGDLDEGEDRVQKKAKLEKLEPIEIAQKYENHFFRDMDRLNCLRPDISCRATGHIPEMIELVETLLEKGYAYKAQGNVYFSVSKFKPYGKLSRRKIEELKDGTRIKTAKDKHNPADFALWKKADDQHLMQWPSPWGRGYPGWHLECSVMSMKYIGESIDIHGGGIDNQFPHHECEIAQSEAATGKPFAKYWLHNNMVTVDGQKMSKSLENFVTVEELLKKYDPMVVRFFILQGHYRSPQDFSEEALDSAKKGFDKLARAVIQVKSMVPSIDPKQKLSSKWAEYRDRFFEFMDDDFNTAGAITVLFDLSRETNELLFTSEMKDDDLSEVNFLFHFLGERILGFVFHQKESKGLESELIEILIRLRDQFRQKKDWTASDEIRKGLEKAGIVIEDGKDGTKWRKK
jgi:cysteinyl-tRNA synthetase